MATTYPLATLAPTISATGISTPTYSDILASLKASFKLIYGNDAYLEPDSQDGQWLAILALAQSDTNNAIVAAYNSYSPQTAVGVGLSQAVKLNYLTRLVATNSTVNLTIGGVAGATINNGVATDATGNRWLLPSSVVIPSGGSIVVTATASVAGAINAAIGAVTGIATPTSGWQTVTNASAASAGNPVETDGQLRARQSLAPSVLSSSVVDAITAALQNLSGVSYAKVYENDTSSTDSNGIPPKSVAAVVVGGAAASVAQLIYDTKGPGTGTFGSTTISTTDNYGLAHSVSFTVPTQVRITVSVTIKALSGYTSAIGTQLLQALSDYVNGLGVGVGVFVVRLSLPAQLYGGSGSSAYELTTVLAAAFPSSPSSADIPITFTQRATLSVADISLTVI